MSPPVLPLVWNQIMKPEWAWINVCLPHMRLWKQVKLMSIEMIWVILERDLICCVLLLFLFASYSSRRMTALVYECMKYICRNLLKKKTQNEADTKDNSRPRWCFIHLSSSGSHDAEQTSHLATEHQIRIRFYDMLTLRWGQDTRSNLWHARLPPGVKWFVRLGYVRGSQVSHDDKQMRSDRTVDFVLDTLARSRKSAADWNRNDR